MELWARMIVWASVWAVASLQSAQDVNVAETQPKSAAELGSQMGKRMWNSIVCDKDTTSAEGMCTKLKGTEQLRNDMDSLIGQLNKQNEIGFASIAESYRTTLDTISAVIQDVGGSRKTIKQKMDGFTSQKDLVEKYGKTFDLIRTIYQGSPDLDGAVKATLKAFCDAYSTRAQELITAADMWEIIKSKESITDQEWGQLSAVLANEIQNKYGTTDKKSMWVAEDIQRYWQYLTFVWDHYDQQKLYARPLLPTASNFRWASGRIVLVGLITGADFTKQLKGKTITSKLFDQLRGITDVHSCDQLLRLLNALDPVRSVLANDEYRNIANIARHVHNICVGLRGEPSFLPGDCGNIVDYLDPQVAQKLGCRAKAT